MPIPAEALHIGRQDDLQRGRLDPQIGQRQRALGHHIVALQQRHLVTGQRRHRQQLQDGGLDVRNAERHRHQQPAAADGGQHDFHQRLEAVGLGPAQFVGLALRLAIRQGAQHRIRHIADIDRLKQRMAATDQRQRRRQPRHGAEPVEERILRPEHDAGAQDRGFRESLANRRLARRFGARIGRVRVGIGADGREMDQRPGADRLRGLGDGPGGLMMHLVKTVTVARRVQDTDQIDDRVSTLHGTGD